MQRTNILETMGKSGAAVAEDGVAESGAAVAQDGRREKHLVCLMSLRKTSCHGPSWTNDASGA